MTRRRLAVDRLNEEAHSELMRLYAWTQQRNAALRQFEECKKTLRSQLGVEPQRSIIDLALAIETGRTPPPPTDPAWGKSNQPGKRRHLSVKPIVIAPVIRKPDLSISEPVSLDHAVPADWQKSSQASGQPDLPISESRPVDEKRMVTAIFFELCQSADLDDEEDSLEERLGPVGRFRERIGVILDQYGGQIESRFGKVCWWYLA